VFVTSAKGVETWGLDFEFACDEDEVTDLLVDLVKCVLFSNVLLRLSLAKPEFAFAI
jgi:hypothetical protein